LKLSIIICVFNEIKTIEDLLKKVLKVRYDYKINYEIIIIDNNSTDGTKKVISKFQDSENIKIIFNRKNYGKGNSIIEGIKIARGKYIVFQDADLEYEPQNFNNLLNHLEKNKLDAVYGSRIKNNEKYALYTINKKFVVFLTNIINFFYNMNYTDTATNHKMIKSSVLKKFNLISKSFAIDFEISILLGKGKYKVDEIPINYFPRSYSQGKKINIIDALKSLIIILIYLIKN